MYEFEDQRLSRPRHLPSSLIPPSRSTSVPPGSTTDGRGEPNGAATSHHYHAPLPPREDHRRSASPAGSLIGEQQPPIMHPNPQIAQQQHHHPHRGGGAGGGGGPLAHPPRSMSPRYFRPPPGVGPPHFRGPGPPWGRGPRPPFDPRFSPRGPPRRHPMGPRGPPGYHPGHRSRMPGMHIFVLFLILLRGVGPGLAGWAAAHPKFEGKPPWGKKNWAKFFLSPKRIFLPTQSQIRSDAPENITYLTYHDIT